MIETRITPAPAATSHRAAMPIPALHLRGESPERSRLRGLGRRLGAMLGLAGAADDRPRHLDQLRLWDILRVAQESAEIASLRSTDLAESERRILMLLVRRKQAMSTELAVALDVDKARVSCVVKNLSERGLVVRAAGLAPLRLSAGGEIVAGRLLRQAEDLNDALVRGLGGHLTGEFHALIGELTLRADLGIDRERHEAGAAATGSAKDGPANNAVAGERIAPALVVLQCRLRRGAALAVKRLAGLTLLEASILATITERRALEWSELIEAVGRDQSQTWRTTKRLIELGLVDRFGEPSRRQGRLVVTVEGRRLSNRLESAEAERHAFVLQTLSTDRLHRFASIVEALLRNAEAHHRLLGGRAASQYQPAGAFKQAICYQHSLLGHGMR
jgi:DNA-binding MarR family transcriptional regulator